MAGLDSISQQGLKEMKPGQYRAIQWRPGDGLGQEGCNVMIKDVQGFLWIGDQTVLMCIIPWLNHSDILISIICLTMGKKQKQE